jgi:protein transport protein SEC61 subunit alpha
MALVIAVAESFAYTYSGMYGDVEKLGAGNAILIVI